MKKFKIPIDIIKKAKKAILAGQEKSVNINKFPTNFKKSIKIELEFYRYLPILREFNIFRFLRKDILATLGKNLTKMNYRASKSL
jgi:hypothetical protein